MQETSWLTAAKLFREKEGNPNYRVYERNSFALTFR